MKLSEVLQDIDLMIPNSLSHEIKIRWINQVQVQLFRDYPLDEAVYPFVTEVGKQLYPLPDDCPQDRIKMVTVNDSEIPYKELNEDSGGTFWTILSGFFMLHPVNASKDVHIYYKRRPTELTTSDLDIEPDFPRDYHELLVIGCAIRVARASQSLDYANQFEKDFSYLADKANENLTKKKRSKVVIREMWT